MISSQILLQIEWPAWIQAGASVFAAIGLVWTLILQRKATEAQIKAVELQSLTNAEQAKVNEAQIKVSDRDYRRFIYELQPIVKATIDWFLDDDIGKITFKVEKNHVKSFHFEVFTDYFVFDKSLIDNTAEIVEGTGIIILFEKKSTLKKEDLDFWINKADFYLTLFYEDVVGTKYQQSIGFAGPDSGMMHMIPKII
jgi:hypothetical protein